MSSFPSMNGKYYRASLDDITSSEGWFKKLLLLGLINFIPIFGQMTVSGYAYEWAHKAAWGMETKMPQKIYGRSNSKMLRWGWFNIVISVVMAIIPYIIYLIGSSMLGVSPTDEMTYYHHAPGMGSYVVSGFGVLIILVAVVAGFFAGFFAWIGTMRMTMYDRLGAGLQFGQIWKMFKHDYAGMFRILGMYLLFSLLGTVVLSIVCLIVLAIGVFLSFAIGGGISYAAQMGDYGRILFDLIGGGLLIMLPLILVVCYASSVYEVFVELLVDRAVGYWTRQFDVARWGKDKEPLPFEREEPKDDGRPVSPSAGQTANGQAVNEQAANGQAVNGQAAPRQPQAPSQEAPAPDPDTVVIPDVPAKEADSEKTDSHEA